jgi:DNA-binding IclR family transcriptional regulator
MDEQKQAQLGLIQIQEAILALLRRKPDGLRNSEIAEALNLRSDFRGRQKDYLTYSVLGGLIHQGRVAWNQDTKRFTAREP